MRITCLHTAQIHVQGFGALFEQSGFAGRVDHVVRADLLDRARAQGAQAVAADLRAVVADIGQVDALLCTCSTLGPLIDELACSDPRLLRIDRPLMEQAIQAKGRVLVVICLQSTQAATLDLLRQIAAESGRDASYELLLCAEVWPLFEAGETDAFARAIAARVRGALETMPDIGVVVLAQASMHGATAHLSDIGLPVLASPQLAVDRAIAMALS